MAAYARHGRQAAGRRPVAARRSHRSLARPRVRIAQRAHGDVLDRPRPDARKGEQAPRAWRRAPPAGRAAGRRRPPRPARAGHRPRARGMPGSGPAATASGRGKRCVSPGRRRAPARRAPAPACAAVRRAAGHADLLAEDRPHRELEAAPGPGHADARRARQPRPDHRIAGQAARERRRIVVEVEDPPGDRPARRRLAPPARRGGCATSTIRPSSSDPPVRARARRPPARAPRVRPATPAAAASRTGRGRGGSPAGGMAAAARAEAGGLRLGGGREEARVPRRGIRAGQLGRQNTPVVRTARNSRPSSVASRRVHGLVGGVVGHAPVTIAEALA